MGSFDEGTDTRLDYCCCRTAAVAEEEEEEEDSCLDLPERAVAAEAGMIVEVERSQARLGGVGRIVLGYHVNRDGIIYSSDFEYQVRDMLGY